MALSTPVPNILTDPGFLLWAPIGTGLPTNTVVAGVFTDDWAVSWVNLGATEDGSQFADETTAEGISVAELFDPIRFKTTGRSTSISFMLASITLSNLKKVKNGGTLTVVSGATDTTLSSYSPPAPGEEVRAMIGWESLDHTLRLVCYQCFQGGDVGMAFKPIQGTDKTTMSATFNLEKPVSTEPWIMFAAGLARG